ncbi:tetratricopeptide repeat protein [Heyndrickxia ginsengihumi]|uniref:tetratricopeptide repeat protein n=1 Tax=Heyndrickxia ginsengihumi TaxID=363870 RepID=UPI000470FC3A|nr:hypothetical protein [Heyndrickxia ginsengihumi]
MKALSILFMIFLLVGCTPQAYSDNLTKGKDAFNDGDYSKAISLFEKAQNEKETDEISSYIKATQLLLDSEQAIKQGKLDISLKKAKQVVAMKGNDSLLKRAKSKAKSLIHKDQTLLSQKKSLEKSIKKGKALLANNQYDEANDVLNKALSKNTLEHPAISEQKSTIKSLIKQAVNGAKTSASDTEQTSAQPQKSSSDNTKSNQDTSSKATSSNTNTNTNQQEGSSQGSSQSSSQSSDQSQDSSTNQGTNQSLTQEEAVNLVKQYLGVDSDDKTIVQYDHDDGQGNYIIHVYEKVIDDPSTGVGHSVTRGWYSVNKKTKKITAQ